MTLFGYVAGPPGQYDIFTMNADGSDADEHHQYVRLE
jgi:hypothetical protein